MNNIVDLLKSNLSSSVIEAMAGRIGGDSKATSNATSSAIQILLSALNKNSQGQNEGLVNALEKDHDGSILDNIMDFAKGSANLNERTTNGSGILGHLLGDKLGNAAEMIARTSGLDSKKSSSLLEMLAPVVMGAVGRGMRQAPGQNSNILTDILSNSVNDYASSKEEQSMVEKLLDRDGDGSVIDDLLGMGMKFFNRR